MESREQGCEGPAQRVPNKNRLLLRAINDLLYASQQRSVGVVGKAPTLRGIPPLYQVGLQPSGYTALNDACGWQQVVDVAALDRRRNQKNRRCCRSIGSVTEEDEWPAR
jgi:hypothetical protein